MTAHTCKVPTPGCFRCELNADELADHLTPDCTCSTREVDGRDGELIHALGCPALGGPEEWDDLERELDYDGLTTCEKHPDKLWSEAHPNGVGLVEACEPGCAGPGMPLAESLAHLGELRQSVRYMAVAGRPRDAQGAAERLVEQWDGVWPPATRR